MAARIGGSQSGAVKRAQLLASGISRHEVDRRANNGHLHRKHQGVYIVGHKALAPTAEEHAALLACGSRAVLSHWSAAYLWGIARERPQEVHITLIGAGRRRRKGVVIRRTTKLTRQDIRRRHGLPLTSPARTVIDLAAHADTKTLERLVAEARVLKLLRPGELEKALTRAGARPGTAVMRAFLEQEKHPALTRSEAERLMRRLVQDTGLPPPITNARIAGYEVDFYWPEQRLIVEVDGYEFHGHRAAFERDRKKGTALTAAGNRVSRITGKQLLYDPLWLAAQLAQALAAES